MRKRLPTLLALLLPLAAQAQAPSAKTLLLQADTYCPYNCDAGGQPVGFTIDIMRAVFEPKGYQLRYEVVPWTRALEQVKSGKADVAVASPPEDARERGLVIGREPVAHSVDCLYVRANNPLQFKQRASDLNSLKRVGTVVDYTYYEWFGEWLVRPENVEKKVMSGGDRPTLTNLKNLVAGRLDATIETRGVMDYLIQNEKLGDQVRIAGCQTIQPVFNVFSPARKDAKQLAAELDDGIRTLRRSGELQKIYARYGMKDSEGSAKKRAPH